MVSSILDSHMDDVEMVDELDMQDFMEKSKHKTWQQLTFWERYAIFNYWSLAYLFSDFFLITGTLVYMFVRTEALEGAEIFLGIGCFLAWCSLSSYLH